MKFDKSQLLIYAVTDRSWTGSMSLYEQTEAALKGGATMVQLREKDCGMTMWKNIWKRRKKCVLLQKNIMFLS